ncbi:MAG: hypothetical protein AAF629_34940 [Chloroflexota bacterium]
MATSVLHSVLRESTLNAQATSKPVDLVVGVAAGIHSPQKSTQFVKQVIAALTSHLRHLNKTFIFVDTGHSPETREAIQAIDIANLGIVTGRYTGVKGEGAAISAIMHQALELGAKAIILLDNNSDGFDPSWIPGFAQLVLTEQADLVKPRYALPPTDSMLSNLLFYPFMRAVWGTAFQHPAATDFAISAKAAQILLKQDVWETDISRAGFHIWLSTLAITEGWPLAQTAISPKHTLPEEIPSIDLTTFREIVGTMLRQLQLKRRLWPMIKHCHPVATLTEFANKHTEEFTTEYADYNESNAIDTLALGWIEYRHLWEKVLLPEHLIAIEYIATKPEDRFYFPPDIWAKVVYDFAVVYNKGELDPDAVVQALYPLYQGRLASFWPEIAGLTAVGRSGVISAQGVEFEELKPYLCHRWKTFQ